VCGAFARRNIYPWKGDLRFSWVDRTTDFLGAQNSYPVDTNGRMVRAVDAPDGIFHYLGRGTLISVLLFSMSTVTLAFASAR
jgi:hypothetical protein